MTITSDSAVCFCPTVISVAEKGDVGINWLVGFHGKRIEPPQRFTPEPNLLCSTTTGSMYRLTCTN